MIKMGDVVSGVITNIVNYGIFVKVDNYDGLVHISQISNNYIKDINNYFKIGDNLKLKVLNVDEEKKQLSLSYKDFNKMRGVQGEIPTFGTGFKTLHDKMPDFIAAQYENAEK